MLAWPVDSARQCKWGGGAAAGSLSYWPQGTRTVPYISLHTHALCSDIYIKQLAVRDFDVRRRASAILFVKARQDLAFSAGRHHQEGRGESLPESSWQPGSSKLPHPRGALTVEKLLLPHGLCSCLMWSEIWSNCNDAYGCVHTYRFRHILAYLRHDWFP